MQIYDESGEFSDAPSKHRGDARRPYAIYDEMDSLFNEYRMAFDEMFCPTGSAAPRIRSGKMIRAMPDDLD